MLARTAVEDSDDTHAADNVNTVSRGEVKPVDVIQPFAVRLECCIAARNMFVS